MKKAIGIVALIIVVGGGVGIWFAARRHSGVSPPTPPAQSARPGPEPSAPPPERPKSAEDTGARSNQEQSRDVLRRARTLARRADVNALVALREEAVDRAEGQGQRAASATKRLLRQLDRYLNEARTLRLRLDGLEIRKPKESANARAVPPVPRPDADRSLPTIRPEPERPPTVETPVTRAPAPPASPAPEPPRSVETRPGVVAAEPVPPRPSTSEVDLASVQRVLGRYEQMYDQLDVSAASSIWPGLDSRALAKVFARLERQDLNFDGCAVAFSDSRATAQCTGWLSYVPRVGNATLHREHHSWTIEFERSGGEWRILQVGAH
jgi:hypothetical protein